jgi:cysteine-rich repeat protein
MRLNLAFRARVLRTAEAVGAVALTLTALTAAGCASDPQLGGAGEALSGAQCDYFGGVDGKVNVCHHTGSTHKPYNVLRVPVAACADHAGHDGDYVTSLDPASPLYDPTCSGQGCFPEGAPYDGSVECCDGLEARDGTCQAIIVCGDGVVGGGEECDDGGTAAGDGCSPTCTVEPPPADCGPTIDGEHYAASGDATYLPTANEGANALPFSLECPCDSIAVGFRGVTLNYFGFSGISRFQLICATSTGELLTQVVGADGGTPFEGRCPAGHALTGQQIGWNIVTQSITGHCTALVGGATATIGPFEDTTGVQDSVGNVTADCPAGTVATGAQGKSGSALDSLGFHCRAI